MRSKKFLTWTCDICSHCVQRKENTPPSDWSSIRTPRNTAKPAALDLCGTCTKNLYEQEPIKIAIAKRLENYPF